MRKLNDCALADGSLGPSLFSGSISRRDERVPWPSARKTSVSAHTRTREYSVVYRTAGKRSPPTRLSTYVPATASGLSELSQASEGKARRKIRPRRRIRVSSLLPVPSYGPHRHIRQAIGSSQPADLNTESGTTLRTHRACKPIEH